MKTTKPTKTPSIPNTPNIPKFPTFRLDFIGSYFTISPISLLILGLIFTLGFLIGTHTSLINNKQKVLSATEKKESYWFVLHRKSQVELLYKGIPGSPKESSVVKTFIVKTGIPGERPTPLPHLVAREYWLVTDKSETDNPETAPYFLTLNVPISEEAPFGPTPYMECINSETGQKEQCNWELPGAFGLHGINGDLTRLSFENRGSSGCIRHSDEDIRYLYNLLNPLTEEIRYYIQDI